MAQPDLNRSAPRVLVSGLVLDDAQAGIARHASELLPRAAERLATRGGSLAVLAGKGGLGAALGPEIERLDSNAAGHPAWRRARDEGRALRAALAAARTAGRPFDLVHTSHLPVPRQLPVPLVWLVHDLRRLDRGGALSRTAGRLLAQAAARRAAKVLAVSRFTAQRLQETLGVEAALVPNAGGHLEPLPRSPAGDAGLLHVGHLEPRKNLDLLVRALALDPGLPDLWLAGAPKGSAQADLRALAASLGVQDRLRLLGSPGDDLLPTLYSTCAAVVLPSSYEGFGLAALEAILAGCPLACSDIPAHREVTGGHAAYFDPASPQACAAALRQALEEQARPAARAHAGRYSWDASAAALVDAWTLAAR